MRLQPAATGLCSASRSSGLAGRPARVGFQAAAAVGFQAAAPVGIQAAAEAAGVSGAAAAAVEFQGGDGRV